jgi:apolipoprotein N-acyltransferase
MSERPAFLSHRYFNLIAVIGSGLLWYLAVDVSGDFGWLLWIAPLPLIVIAFQSTTRVTFLCAFIAYFIGRLSWVPYLMRVLPVFLVPVFTLLMPLIYALTLIGVRKLVLKWNNAWMILIYPAFVTAVEFIAMSFSADGTAGSIAYTQSNYLPIIQIASVTGIWGIVFVTGLLPSTIALALHLKDRWQKQMALLAGSLLLLSIIGFGWIRLSANHNTTAAFKAGLTVVDERLHQFPSAPDLTKEKKVAEEYIRQIKVLANEGAEIVLFPEKAINAAESQKDSIKELFKKSATSLNISIAGGFTIFREKSKQNLVLFFSPDGDVQEYMKNFHVNGWEDEFERGNVVGSLKGLPMKSGMAICKDMDFPEWLRKYSDEEVLFVPAWDFVVDGWLHDRMAVMRGVENGYTLVRAARQGRFTISDYKGNVLSEANCENGKSTSLIANVPVYRINTIYSQWGDWFGVLSVIVIVVLFIIRIKK